MSFDWREYIKLAEDLIKNQTEATLRSSISRAYYGIFCISRNRAGFKNCKQPDVHKKVIGYYKDSSDSWEKCIGKFLDELRRDRNYADYDEDKAIDVSIAQRVLKRSKKILKKLYESLSNQPNSHIPTVLARLSILG